jgi:hypothetical protein
MCKYSKLSSSTWRFDSYSSSWFWNFSNFISSCSFFCHKTFIKSSSKKTLSFRN